MTQQDTIALEHFSTTQSFIPRTPEPESEISLIDIAALLLRHKKLVGGAGLLATLLGAVTIWLLPPNYVAEAMIMPPQQAQSSIAALASGAIGGLAGSGMASQLGLKNPADLYIGILKSRTITDAIVDRFHLKEVYKNKLTSDTRKSLSSHASFTSGKDSLITISIKDHDPQRAAAMANAFADELHNQNSRLALTDASQRRLFFEQQLVQEKDALANAEVGLKKTQQSTGLLAPAGQAEALIKSAASLRAEIASRQVEIEAMRSYATDANPQLQLLKKEISAFQSQLNQAEATGSGSKFEVAGNRLPEASLEYIRKLRDVKYHETLFELLAKQYEIARLDEAKQAPVIQVVDRAVPPDAPSRPSRAIVILATAVAGLIGGALVAFFLERVQKLRADLRAASA